MNLAQFRSNFTWDYSNEIITTCECYSSNCLTRKIVFYDFFQEKNVKLNICNSVIKLYFENVGDFMFETFKLRINHYSELVESIIDDYYLNKYDFEFDPKMYTMRFKQKELSKIQNVLINIEVSERPFIYKSINIEKCLKLIIDKKVEFSLIYDVKKALKNYLLGAGFNKNKTLKESIVRELKKINSCNPDIEVDVINIVNSILILILKNKKE